MVEKSSKYGTGKRSMAVRLGKVIGIPTMAVKMMDEVLLHLRLSINVIMLDGNRAI